MLILPFKPSIGSYRFSADIEDATYIFDVEWNARDNVSRTTGLPLGAWYFHIYEQNLKRIACSLKIVTGAYIGRRVNHPLFRRGVMVAIDTSGGNGRGRDAGFDDLGTRAEGQRVEVRYYTATEIDTIVQELRARIQREAA